MFRMESIKELLLLAVTLASGPTLQSLYTLFPVFHYLRLLLCSARFRRPCLFIVRGLVTLLYPSFLRQ